MVVTATGVEDPLAHAERVGDVEAGCGGDAVQVHAVVVGRSIVVEFTAVVEGRNAGDGDAVGVQVSPLRVLDEGEAATVKACAQAELVVRGVPGERPGEAIGVLAVHGVGVHAGALLSRLTASLPR